MTWLLSRPKYTPSTKPLYSSDILQPLQIKKKIYVALDVVICGGGFEIASFEVTQMAQWRVSCWLTNEPFHCKQSRWSMLKDVEISVSSFEYNAAKTHTCN